MLAKISKFREACAMYTKQSVSMDQLQPVDRDFAASGRGQSGWDVLTLVAVFRCFLTLLLSVVFGEIWNMVEHPKIEQCPLT